MNENPIYKLGRSQIDAEDRLRSESAAAFERRKAENKPLVLACVEKWTPFLDSLRQLGREVKEKFVDEELIWSSTSNVFEYRVEVGRGLPSCTFTFTADGRAHFNHRTAQTVGELAHTLPRASLRCSSASNDSNLRMNRERQQTDEQPWRLQRSALGRRSVLTSVCHGLGSLVGTETRQAEYGATSLCWSFTPLARRLFLS